MQHQKSKWFRTLWLAALLAAPSAWAWTPVANNDSYTTDQNVTLTVTAPGVLANDTDADGDALTATLVSNPSHGTLALNANGSFTYRPATNYNGADSFTYKASDGSKVSGVATVNITVRPVSIVVVTPPQNQTNCPGSTAVFSVTATGTSLKYQWSRGTNTLAGQTNSTLTLANVTATDAGTYSVKLTSGSASSTNSATLTISTAVSATPLISLVRAIGANAVFNTVASGTGPFTYVWRKNGAVISGQTSSSLILMNLTTNATATYSVVVSGACGSVTNGATLFVDTCFPSVDVMLVIDRSGSMNGQPWRDAKTAASNFVSNLKFGTNADLAGLVSYNSAATLDQRLTNNVTAVRQSIGSIAAANGYTSISSGLQTAQDEMASSRHNPDALPVILLLSDGLPTQGDTPANALAVATQAKNAGSRIFTVGLGDVDHALMAGIASSTNDYFYTTNSSQLTALFNAISTVICRPPTNIVATGPTNLTVCAGATATFSVSATGCMAFRYQWQKDGVNLAGRTNSTIVLTNVALTNAGTYSVIVLSDCQNKTNSATLTVNSAVQIISPPMSRTNCPGTSASFNVSATGTALRYQWFRGSNTLAGQTNNSLTLNNVSAADAGNYSVTVSGACGAPVTTSATLTVNQEVEVVTPPAAQTGFVGGSITFSVGAIGTGVTYQWFFNGTLLSTSSTLALSNLTTNQAGTYCVIVRGACGNPITNCTTLTIQNRAPTANDDSYTVREDTTLTIAAPGVLANDVDPDGDALTSVLLSNVTHGVLAFSANGSFVYTPAANFNGTDTFLYRARDGASFSGAATVRITVTPTNDAPVARDDSYTIAEDTTLTITAPGVLANDTDVDGDPLTAIIVSNPTHGTLSLSTNGGFDYRPNTNYNGMDTFTYRASDGSLTSDAATVTLTVSPVNDPPVARDDSYTTPEDTVLTVAAPGVLANDSDVDGTALTALIVSNPTRGALTLNPTGGFTYRPNTNFNGTDTFTYRATDGGLTSLVATVTLTVTPVNDRPTPGAVGDNYSVLEDQTLTVAAPGVLGNDSDIDGDPLVAIFISAPAHGTVTLNTNGSFVYVPSANYFGADSFVYVANDGRTSSVPAVVNITVTPVNDTPSFVSGGDQKVNQNSPMQTVNWASNISVGPPNESGQTALFWVSNDNPSLFAMVPAIAPDGKLRYRPATNAFGVATVRVTLRDDGGTANGGVDTSSEVTFSITINGPPTVSIISPLDGTVLINPATFSVLADASDPDGTVTNVLFVVNGAAFTNVAQPPFYFVMTNTPPGNYQFRAVAADNCGLLATSAVVNVRVVTNTVIASGPLVLNHQNGLFEQFVTISNLTSETWLNGVRLQVLNLDSTNRVYNFTGTNANGTPYLDATAPVPPGGLVTMVVQYYVPNPRSVPNPLLIATPLPFVSSLAPKIMRVQPAPDGTLKVHFKSQDGRFYFLQYSEDLVRWTTDPIRMTASGPMTIAPAHKAGAKCFYRVLLIP